MKYTKILIAAVCGLFTGAGACAQPGATPVSVSLSEGYRSAHPQLTYAYDDQKRTHDYSGNWDFDGDGRKDKLLFIGDDAVHVYYHLQLWLSSERKARTYSYLVTDLPLLGKYGELTAVQGKIPPYPKFVVHDFNGDGLPDIYINADLAHKPVPAPLKKAGISAGNILLEYRDHDMRFRSFKGR